MAVLVELLAVKKTISLGDRSASTAEHILTLERAGLHSRLGLGCLCTALHIAEARRLATWTPGVLGPGSGTELRKNTLV